ncbi:hypothetical protein ACIBAH_32295 [Streptomyces sp. NPDC051445]|uniref:hypothetical protein n=1 Tax=Streptomyces sp. NPDC051445 TaxID=3365653 RepID=UPI0037A4E980
MAAAPAARLEETLTDCGERDTRALPVLVSNAPRFDVAPTVTAVSAVLIAPGVLALASVALVRRLGGHRDGQNVLLLKPVT